MIINYTSVMWNLLLYILFLEPIYDIYVIRNTCLAANLMNEPMVSICLKMEDDINILKLEDDPIFFENGRQPQFLENGRRSQLLKMEGNPNCYQSKTT